MLAEIRELRDDSLILPLLEQDRRWAVYALCDLDPPYRENSRYLGAIRDGRVYAVLLLYRLPKFVTIAPFGDTQGVLDIFAGTADLPRSAFLMVRDDALPAVRRHYTVDDAWIMERMAVEPAGLQLSPPVDLPLMRLTPEHLPALMSLYGISVDSFFLASMLVDGIFYAAVDGSRLVAVAGTHTVSRRHRVATIGGVFTDPAYRGCGLATATTGAVIQALLPEGIDLIALNVRQDNGAAIAAYRHLGFTEHVPFWEGHATLR
jgi:ribosomal protein S18 acetylase RimI-like enzyme